MVNERAETERKRGGETVVSSTDVDRDASKSDAAITVGSRKFRSVNGIWTDTAYNGGATIAVKRDSDDFKRLDPDLQKIARSLRGTVIIVWTGKNYKIQ